MLHFLLERLLYILRPLPKLTRIILLIFVIHIIGSRIKGFSFLFVELVTPCLFKTAVKGQWPVLDTGQEVTCQNSYFSVIPL